jgi:predicted nucleic acid-binding protein
VLIDTNIIINILTNSEKIEQARFVFNQIEIISLPSDFGLMLAMIRYYRSLPDDVVIAATCKENGITKIATFDSDFKRVDFLEVIGE